MKVIVASSPKCGTKTLHKCLEILGYSVYDFDSQLYCHEKEWKRILTYGSTPEVFRKMFENVDCVCDLPGYYYWEEIHKAFPDSKIILTMRSNEDEWYKSFKKQVDGMNTSTIVRLQSLLTRTGRKTYQILQLFGHVAYGSPPQGFLKAMNSNNAENTKKLYRRHNDSVLTRAPKHKLLVLDFADGWKPLCEFLGKDVPDVPFPHENIGSELTSKLGELPLFAQTFKELIVVLSILCALIAVLLIYLLC